MLLEDTPVSIFLYWRTAAGSLQVHIHLRLSKFWIFDPRFNSTGPKGT